MKDELTNQEEQLRDLTKNFSLDIDTSEIWNNVESRLPGGEKKRRPIVWWFITGALVLVIGILMWNNYSSDSILNKTTDPSINSNDSNEALLITEVPNQHTKNTPLVKTAKDSKTVTNLKSSSNIKESNSIQKSPSTLKIQKKNTSIINYNRYDDKPTFWKEEEIDQSPVVEKTSIATLINPSSSEEGLIMIGATVIERQTLNYIHANILMPSFLEREKGNDVEMSHIQIKPFKISYWKPYFALASGVNFNNSNIYSNSNETLNMDQFQAEKSLPSFSSTLKFGYEHSSGWRFGLGLAHHKFVNSYHQIETISSTKEINGIKSFNIDGEGNIISTAGLITETTVTNYDFKWHRKHDFLNVQLSVGKRLMELGKFTLYTDANISKNIWSRHSGYYFTENEVLISRFESGQNNPYTNAGYGLGLSLDLEYSLNEFSISVSPFASMGLNSITRNSNYYQLKNSQYGIQIGIVYRP